MSATWILVLIALAAITARAMRSTKMWWVLLFTLFAGLLVGMLSKEAVNHYTKHNDLVSITQSVNTGDSINLLCMLPVATVTEGATHGVTGYVANYIEMLPDAFTDYYTTNGRDSPAFEDDS